MTGAMCVALGASAYGVLPGGGMGLSVTATPPGSHAGGAAAPYDTPPVTALPAGGSGTYTYAWVAVAGEPIVITSPAAATTALRFVVVPVGALVEATVRCTVTDTMGGLTGSVDVAMSYQREGSSG